MRMTILHLCQKNILARFYTQRIVTAKIAPRFAVQGFTTTVRLHSEDALKMDSQSSSNVTVNHHVSASDKNGSIDVTRLPQKQNPIKLEVCNDDDDDLDEEMEQEEMFVDAYESFEYKTREWGGPRRGGRLPEPTRYGDWERKGRCSDF